MKIVEDYETACVLDDRELYKDSYNKWAVEMEIENLQLCYQYLRDFLPHLSAENETSFDLAIKLQFHPSVKKTNIAFLIVPYNVGHLTSDLENLAEKNDADYIVITPTVEFYAIRKKIYREPSYYLYDHKLKKIVVETLDSDFDKVNNSRVSRGNWKTYQVTTYNDWAILRILSAINPSYQLENNSMF